MADRSSTQGGTTTGTETSQQASAAPEETTVDVLVLGAGPVGENIAQYAVEDTDLTAALVEGELVGGECSYWACMPSKALLRPLDVADSAAHLDGITTPHVEADALLARRDVWVSHYDDASQVSWAEGAGLQVLRGHARIVGERLVEITSTGGAAGDASAGGGEGAAPTVRRVRARRAVVIATGSQPRIPEALRPTLPWGSRDATGVREIPRRLAVIGGGVVAVEAATWMSALGSEVTLIVRGGSLLSGDEPFAGEAVAASLRAAGVRVETSSEVTSAERDDARDTGVGRVHGGAVHLTVHTSSARAGTEKAADGADAGDDGTHPAGTWELEVDELLVATGRTPRLEDVGLDAVGLTPTDVTSGRTPSWLFAVGDASGEAPLTHWGKYRARVLGDRIRSAALGEEPETVPADVPVPQVVFTDPQVASVGLTEARARDVGHDVVLARVELPGAAGVSLLRDDASGVAQIVVDRATHLLLGATFVGPEMAEVVHAATVAIVGKVPVDVLRHAVASYPTSSELWLRLLEELPRELRRPA